MKLRKMKHISIKIAFLAVTLLAGCDSNFEELNKNPNAYTEPVINSLFSSVALRAAGVSAPQHNNKEAGCFMQYYTSLNAVQWAGDKYLFSDNYNGRLWRVTYPETMKETVQLLHLLQDDPEMVNQYNIVRIMKVYIMHRVTDMYGDVPYFEAGLGYISGVYKPKYDRQSEIYADMLKELDEAAVALDPSKPSYGPADFVYDGDVVKWKRFAYSMMLRLGMRLTKVDAAMAETWVKKAIAGGVMQSNDDLARMIHEASPRSLVNWSADQIRGAEGVNPAAEGRGLLKMNKTFIDHLKETNDPRMPFLVTLWEGNVNVANLPQSTEPERQKGLPGGYDNNSIRTIIPNWDSDMLREYSEPNIHTFLDLTSPDIFQSCAEVKLLLAEAALRGWTTGSSREYYEDAVRCSLGEQELFPNGMGRDAALVAANDYLAANPYPENGTFDEQMEQIHTQFWVAVFPNNLEVYANWRRTDYPKLIPTNYPGNETGGVIPRRLVYLVEEKTLNTENYEAAIAAQGPDLMLTSVWWDKE